MPNIKAGPDHFHHRITKFVFGAGGIIWEEDGKLLRSDANGVNWSVVSDPQDPRPLSTNVMNCNWRGPYVDGKPRYEVSWMGEAGRNFHMSSRPIQRVEDFLFQGRLYEAPGFVCGGFVATSSFGPNEGVTYLVVLAGNLSPAWYRCPITNLGPAGGLPPWEFIGAPSVSGNAVGGSTSRRSVFFNPNGTEGRAVWWIYDFQSGFRDAAVAVEYRTFTVAADVSSISDTRVEYGPYTIRHQSSGTTFTPTGGITATFLDGPGGSPETREMYIGTLLSSDFLQEENESGTVVLFGFPAGTSLVLGADYTPEGVLREFEVSFNISGSFTRTVDITIDDYNNEVFEDDSNDGTSSDFGYLAASWQRNEVYTASANADQQFTADGIGSWSAVHQWDRNGQSVSNNDEPDRAGDFVINTVGWPGVVRKDFVDDTWTGNWYWISFAVGDGASGFPPTRFGPELFVQNETLDFLTPNVTYLDLRYGHLVKHDVTPNQAEAGKNLVSDIYLDPWEETTQIYFRGSLVYTSSYEVGNPGDIDDYWRPTEVPTFHFRNWFNAFLNPDEDPVDDTASIHLVQPWPLLAGDEPYPSSADQSASGTTGMFGLNTRYQRNSYSIGTAASQRRVAAATDPKGGLVVLVPSDATVPGADAIVGFMSGGDDLETLLNAAGVAVTLSASHQFNYVPR